MKSPLRFKIIRWTRQVRAWFGLNKGMEPQHYFYTLSKPLTPEQIWQRLWPYGWGYNTLSHMYKEQILTVRRLDPPRHQWHLRFYSNGNISGHYETDPIQFPLEHIDGVELRPLSESEVLEIKRQLGLAPSIHYVRHA